MEPQDSLINIEPYNFPGEDPLVAITVSNRKHQDFSGGKIKDSFSAILFKIIERCVGEYKDYKLIFIVPPNYIPAVCLLARSWSGAWANEGHKLPVIIVAGNQLNIRLPKSRKLFNSPRILISLRDDFDERSIRAECTKVEGVIAFEINSSARSCNPTIGRLRQAETFADLLDGMKKRKS